MSKNGKLSSGIIQFAGANTPGWISNLGIDLTAGTLSVTDISGGTLSNSNPGWVTVPSTTGGQFSTLKVSTSQSFNDDAHASSDLTNLGFGITETVDWGSDLPFFLYVVNRGDSDIDGTDGNSSFFLARNPSMTGTPSSGDDIGDTSSTPVNDSQTVILLMGDSYTQANYTSLPCQLVGAIRMQWSTSTDDWTVQTLGNTDGVGDAQLEKTFITAWDLPQNQNGADASTHLVSTGGTLPSWATPANFEYKYLISRLGDIECYYSTGSAGLVTNGSGTDNIHISLPADSVPPVGMLNSRYAGTSFILSATWADVWVGIGGLGAGSASVAAIAINGGFNSVAGSRELRNNDFTGTGDHIYLRFTYKAF